MFYIRKILDDGLFEVLNTAGDSKISLLNSDKIPEGCNTVALLRIKELGYDRKISILGVEDIERLENSGYKVIGYSNLGKHRAFHSTCSVIRHHLAAMKISGFTDVMIFEATRGLILEEASFAGAMMLPSYITDIGDDCFKSNTNLKSVVFKSENFGLISDSAFKGCSSLQRIMFTGCVDVISHYAFSGTGLVDIALSCRVIDLFAFCSTSLETVKLTDCIFLGRGAFANCTQLSSVFLPKSVEVIEDNCFAGVSENCVITVESKEVRDLVKKSGYTGNILVQEV